MDKLYWYTLLALAAEAALAQGKDILLVGGRRNCSRTTWMRETVCETAIPPIRSFIDKNLIPLWVDPDVSSDGEQYLTGTGEYTFPHLALIDPNETSKPIVQRTDKPGDNIDAVKFYDWLKSGLKVAGPVVIPPKPPELDAIRLMADFQRGKDRLVVDIPQPWCGGVLLKPHAHFGGPYINWTDNATKTVVKNLQDIKTFDVFMEKLYEPFPNIKRDIDAAYMKGDPPVVPPPVEPPPVLPLTEYEKLSALIDSGDTKAALNWIKKKIYGLSPE